MKNKKGKKLVVLGAMAALLTLIGVSGSQTYAKYVETTQVKSQTATVARWGYVVSVDASNLFGSYYDSPDANELASVSVENAGIVVGAHTSAADEIVAPGTKGEITINVRGYAEVDSTLSFSDLTSSEINLNEEYYPMVWDAKVVDNTVGGVCNVDTIAAGRLGTDAGVYKQLKDAASFHFNAGTEVDFTITLSWEWAFDEPDTALTGIASDLITGGGAKLTSDQADTYLGIIGASQVSNGNSVNNPTYENIRTNYGSTSDLQCDLSFSLTMSQEQKVA